jgi:hypothetical protein
VTPYLASNKFENPNEIDDFPRRLTLLKLTPLE